MIAPRYIAVLLRAAALAAALIPAATSIARADPPGYYFQDAWRPAPPPSAAISTAAPCGTTAAAR